MEKVYTIEVMGRADFCIGAFANYDKAKIYYEKVKPLVGKENAHIVELQLARGIMLIEWKGEEWKIIEDWEYKTED